MQVRDLDIAGVKLIGPPERHGDDRGWFCEQFSARVHAAAGLDHAWVQDNLSFSRVPGTIRGLHFQPPPSAQAKLVSVLAGAVLDVVVDIRHGRALPAPVRPDAAPRAADSRLDGARLEAAFGLRLRPWPEALAEVMEQLGRGLEAAPRGVETPQQSGA